MPPTLSRYVRAHVFTPPHPTPHSHSTLTTHSPFPPSIHLHVCLNILVFFFSPFNMSRPLSVASCFFCFEISFFSCYLICACAFFCSPFIFCRHRIADSRDSLTNKLWSLEEEGPTALGSVWCSLSLSQKHRSFCISSGVTKPPFSSRYALMSHLPPPYSPSTDAFHFLTAPLVPLSGTSVFHSILTPSFFPFPRVPFSHLSIASY